MAGFKQGGIHLKSKTSAVSADPGYVLIYSKTDGELYRVNEHGQETSVKGVEYLSKNVKTYGAVGDGIVDDTLAIQSALISSGDVYIPPGTYKINKAIRVYSNTNLTLSPNATLVNTKTDVNTYEWACLALGDMHPTCLNYNLRGTSFYLPAYDINDTVAGQTILTCISAANSNNFSIGQMVIVRSISQRYSGDYIPDYIQICKVQNISSGNIMLDMGLTEAISGATVSPLGTTIDNFTGVPWSIVDNVHIDGGRYNGISTIWGRGGMYRSSIKNIVMAVPQEHIGTFNACGRSVFDGIYGIFSRRAFELKCGSHDVYIRNINMSYKKDPSVTVLSGIEIGEQSRDVTIERAVITIGDDCNTDVTACNAPGRRIVIKDSIFSNLTTNVGSTVMAIPSLDLGSYPCKDITLENVELIGSTNRSSYLRCGYSTSTSQLDFINLSNVRFTGGTPYVAHINYENTTINVFTRNMGNYISNRYSNSLPSGNVQTIGVGSFSAVTGTPVIATYGFRGNCWAMDASTTEEIGATVPAPLRARSVSAELIYCNLGAGTGDVKWDLTMCCVPVGGNGNALTSQEQMIDTAPVLHYTKAVQFYGANKVATDVDMLVIRVRRMGLDAADTLTNDAGVLGVRLRWY